VSRIIIVTAVTVGGITWPKGATLEVTAAQLTTIGAGNTRAPSATTMHDTLGMSVGVSNSSA
jgi:hypothetical protein